MIALNVPMIRKKEFTGWAMPMVLVPLLAVGAGQYYCDEFSFYAELGSEVGPDSLMGGGTNIVCSTVDPQYYEPAPEWVVERIAARMRLKARAHA